MSRGRHDEARQLEGDRPARECRDGDDARRSRRRAWRSVRLSGQASPDYREARATVTLGKGESKEVTISCPFEPESLVVDPDAKVLQLQRKHAIATF